MTVDAVMDWLRLFSAAFLFTLLVVLIFFMAVLPIRPDVPAFIDVPTTRSASKSPEFEGDLTISIRANGRIYLASVEIEDNVLAHRLSLARLERRRSPTLRVRADRAAMFRDVRIVVRAAQAAGFARVTFMVRQKSVEEGFSLSIAPPDKLNPWPAIGIAITCLAGAVTIRFVRHSPSTKPGCAGWLLLLLAALALVSIWSAYHPSCPPGVWC